MQYRIERVGMHILAFFIARCEAFGMYPFVVPFFMAAYIQKRSSMGLFCVLMLGLFSRLELVAACRYATVLLFLLVMLGHTDRKQIFENNYQIALAVGAVLWAITMPYQYIVTGRDISLLYALLEGIIAGSFTLIFEQGIMGFRAGTDRMFAGDKRFIGIFVCLTAALFGVPVMEKPVNLLFFVCSLLLVCYVYRFGGSIGIAAGSVTGMVLSFQFNKVSYLAVMVLLAGIMILLRELGKVGILLAYLSGNILLGFLYEHTLLTPQILSAALETSLVFVLLPSRWLKRPFVASGKDTGASENFLVQEATRNRIENFGQAFLAIEKMLTQHEEKREAFTPNGLSNMYLSGDGISLLNAVESQSNRLTEMRMNFIRQLGRIGGIITSFQSELVEGSARMDYFENRIRERLERMGVQVVRAVSLRGKNGRLEVYLSCMAVPGFVVDGKRIALSVSKVLGKNMVCVDKGEHVVGKQEEMFFFIEEGTYMLTTGIVRKNREGERLCGDNFSVTKLDTQKAVLMISDGMGFGESAYVKSGQILELLEQLLSAGFCRDLAIELLNSVISFLAEGNGSSTLDLVMIDFYTGDADFIKLGASTTFIKRADNVECIRSTSLPVGLLEQVEFDTCGRKLYHGDMVVMVSDGILDGIIFEDKEAYLAELIGGMKTNNAQVMAQTILENIEDMHRGNMRDDSTVLVAGLWER